jgi:UDP-N-acetylmuramate--alanine ligase
MDPTVINGGIINAWGSNARLGGGEWMVAEADESDGTFVHLPASVVVVTNIDPEHLDHYGSFDELRGAFDTFVANIPFYGFAVLCIDHPEVQAMIPRVSDRRIVTYGFSPQADVRAVNLETSLESVRFDAQITDRKTGAVVTLERLELPMLGEHNVENALAAIAIAAEMDIPEDMIRRALGEFEGVRRRFTRTGDVGGIVIIDDYGHHPVEIAAVLKTARVAVGAKDVGVKGGGQVIAVFQPHRYTRLRDLFEEFCTCFNDADAVVVAHVYEAGEDPIKGIDRDSLVEGLGNHGHRTVLALDDPAGLADVIHGLAGPGDMVVCLGAGDITHWANALPDDLRRLQGKGREAANDDG